MRVLSQLIWGFLALLSVVGCSVIPLERAFPLNKRVELSQLVARDQLRHSRILMGFVGGVVDFSVQAHRIPTWSDLVLKDKIFVYDLARQQIGWANYDCLSLNRNQSSSMPESSPTSPPPAPPAPHDVLVGLLE